MRQFARVIVLSTVALAALAIAPAPSGAIGRPCAQGDIRVAIVVDFGDGSSVSVTCVPAGSRANGAQLLGTRASILETADPRFNASGLLCAIDNVPPTGGCGERTSGRYAYWSYWHGVNGTWSYANSGPAGWRVQDDVVEGWRFQPQGAGNPSDPPPRASASPPTSCRPAPVTTSPPATVAPAGTAAPAQTPGGAGSPMQPTAGPLGATRGATPTTRAAPSGRSTATTVTAQSAKRPASSSTSFTSTTAAGLDRAAAAARTRRSDNGDGGGGAPVGLIIGVVLVAGLGAGGAAAARRRRTASP